MANFFNQSSLSPEQQDVLIAALNSSRQDQTNDTQPPTSTSFDFASGSLTNPIFSGFSQPELNGGFSEQQFLDYLGSNNNFDYDSIAPEDTVEDPTSPDLYDDEDNDIDLHDKRKSPTDGEENGTAKRREGDEKVAKKPGRKPLTTEPTSKRKAQNRAAQRAFRDRKERHLKELETKVDELEKSSESINHENGLLRAQVEKLTNEVKEYRKRMSSSTSVRPSPQNTIRSFSNSSNGPVGPNWNFEYPQFGSSNSHIPLYNNRPSLSSIAPTEGFDTGFLGSFSSSRKDSSERSNSTSQRATPALSDFIKSPSGSVNADSPQTSISSASASHMFKPLDTSIAHPQGVDSPKSYNIFTSTQTHSPLSANLDNLGSENNNSSNRIFKFSSNTPTSSSGSPSSFTGPSSSCGTSPEPSGQMGSSVKELESINENQAMVTDNNTSSIFGNVGEGFDFSNFAGGQAKDPFAPDSWMDTDNNNAFFGGDAMFSGFSDESSNAMDMFAPMNWNDLTGVNMQTGLTPAIQKSDPMESIQTHEQQQPGTIPCHKIWDKIQMIPQVKDGSLDIDSLCQELKQKAKCSETGIVIEQKDIDEAILRTKRTPTMT